jgi:putative ABC transport system permease protein
MSGIIVLCLTITIFLPLVTFRAVEMVDEHLYARSKKTPLLVGSKGSPFLLTLNSIYFKTRIKERLPYAAVKELESKYQGRIIPLHTFHSVRGIPVVGTSFDYFTFRELEPREGNLPLMLGDAVLGSRAAVDLRARVGGSIISDAESIYNISAEYPLKMRVTGILEPTDTPDDNVVFVDLKTAWVIDGIGHGHENLVTRTAEVQDIDLQDPDLNPDDAVLFIEASEIVYNSRLKKYNEITAENMHSFHFHGDRDTFPLSALILVPANYREEVLTLSELNLSKGLQAVRPTGIVEEILDILLNVKRVFDGFSALVFVSTVAFMILVISLQIRQRRGEMLILYHIGGGKHLVKTLLGIEVVILVAASGLLAFILSMTVLSMARSYLTG